jgi:hypothetical protein
MFVKYESLQQSLSILSRFFFGRTKNLKMFLEIALRRRIDLFCFVFHFFPQGNMQKGLKEKCGRIPSLSLERNLIELVHATLPFLSAKNY